MIVLACLALNVAAFFYLHAWRPVADFIRAFRQVRLIRAYRIAGLLLLLLAANVLHVAPVHAQGPEGAGTHKIWCRSANDIPCLNASQRQAIAEAERLRKAYTVTESTTSTFGTYSDGDDALLAKYRQPDDTTGFPALDKALRYVWDNAGKLTLIFALLAGCYLLMGKLEQSGETYGDVLRREAAERWEEETDDDSIHNPFNSPEGMQPTTQYVPVRTRR
jgi:hypothetical protein